jgi:hypothetical protein
MKKIISTFLALATAWSLFAQNSVGIGTAIPNTSAVLDISSTSKGLLTPRMSTVQRNAISTPAKGLLVYDTDLNALYHYNGNVWTAVGGSGSFSLPYSGSTNQTVDAFSISNTSAGTAISGAVSANSVAAIKGNSTATVGGYGVLGSSTSTTGFGIGGINETGTAVYGFSSGSGTALRGVSTNGYGLLSSGNLRLTGGNTNPSAGAVLTSVDANGNAVWKPKKIAFNAYNTQTHNIAHNTLTTLFLDAETFDYGNNFNVLTAPVDNSTFIVPVSGVYHLSARSSLSISSLTTNIYQSQIRLRVNDIDILEIRGNAPDNQGGSSEIALSLSETIHLNAGDKVKIIVIQKNQLSITGIQLNSTFNGHLVFAD